eukprot:tig00020816_g14118.t1
MLAGQAGQQTRQRSQFEADECLVPRANRIDPDSPLHNIAHRLVPLEGVHEHSVTEQRRHSAGDVSTPPAPTPIAAAAHGLTEVAAATGAARMEPVDHPVHVQERTVRTPSPQSRLHIHHVKPPSLPTPGAMLHFAEDVVENLVVKAVGAGLAAAHQPRPPAPKQPPKATAAAPREEEPNSMEAVAENPFAA